MNDQSNFPVDEPAIGVSFKHQLDDYRELVFQGFIPATCSREQLNELLDKLSKASDRQKAKVALPTRLGILELLQKKLIRATEELYGLNMERDAISDSWQRQSKESDRRTWRPSSAEISTKDKLDAKITQVERDIKDLTVQIEGEQTLVSQYEAKLGG